MKTSPLISFIFLVFLLTACQTATPPPPAAAAAGTEFTLAADQTITITATGLKIHLIGVTGDERCPSQIECAASGPVSISLSAQMNAEDPTAINLQTFTDTNGRAPDFQFEKVENRVVYKGYLIRIVGVWPYPLNVADTIKDSEYRVSLVVSKE